MRYFEINSDLPKISETIQECYDSLRKFKSQQWALTEDEYKDFVNKITKIGTYGTSEQKKQFCRLLYEARTQAEIYPTWHGFYLTFEGVFRRQCHPTFYSEKEFSKIPLPPQFNLDADQKLQEHCYASPHHR